MKTKKLSIKILTAIAVVAMIIAGIFAVYGANNTAKADTLPFEMVSGASLRVNEEGGIRFRAKMNQTKYDEITKNDNVSLAFIIAPAEHFAYIYSNNEIKGKYYETLSVGNRATIVEVDESLIYADGESYYANGCVIDIKEANRKLIFASIAVIITDNGETDSYEYAGIDGKTVDMEGFSFDLARAQFYDLVNQATLDTANDYTGAILNNDSFDWYGTEAHPIAIKTIQAFDKLITKVNAGYTFEGKYILVDSSVNVNDATVELNAGLTMPEYKTLYTVTFKAEDGTVLESKTAIGGSAVEYTGETPVKVEDASASYTFDKWVLTVDGLEDATDALANVNSDLVVYPSFVKNAKSYDVKFVNYDGSELDVISVKYGELPEYVGEEPTRPAEGKNVYQFAGWTPEIVEVTGATTYTAKFDTLAEYVVSTNRTEISFTYVDENSSAEDKAKLPAGNNRGYIAHSAEFQSGSQIKNTVRGNFEAGKTYAFTISSNYVSVVKPEGYTNAWAIKETVNSKLISDWEIASYGSRRSTTYTFTKTMEESSTEQDIIYQIEIPQPGMYGAQVTVALNVEWKEISLYTVTWKNYDGSVLDTDSVAEGQMPVYTGETPVRPASGSTTYEFNGWSPVISEVTGNVEYVATYLENRPYMVSVHDNYKSKVSFAYVDANSSVEDQAKLPTGAKEGYIVSWNSFVSGADLTNKIEGNFEAGKSYIFTVSVKHISTSATGNWYYKEIINGVTTSDADKINAWSSGKASMYTYQKTFEESATFENITYKIAYDPLKDQELTYAISVTYKEVLPFMTECADASTLSSTNIAFIDANSSADDIAKLPAGFTEGYLVTITDLQNANAKFTLMFNYSFEAGKTYKITFIVKEVAISNWYQTYINGTQIKEDGRSLSPWDGVNPYSYVYEYTFNSAESSKSFTYQLVQPSTVINNLTFSIGARIEEVLPYTSSTTESRIESLTLISKTSSAEEQATLPAGAEYGYKIVLNGAAYSNLTITNTIKDTFEAGKTYKFTLNVNRISSDTWQNVYVVDDSAIDFELGPYNKTGTHSFNVTFEEAADLYSFTFRFNNNNGLQSFAYVYSVSWEVVE